MSLYRDPMWESWVRACQEADALDKMRNTLQDRITEMTEGVQHHGRVLDDMENHSELPRGEQSSPNG